MNSGCIGAFVISWAQTEVDGLPEPPVGAITKGAAWSWNGDVLRVDGPANILKLDRSLGRDALRRRAARSVTRLVGDALDFDPARRRADVLEDDSFDAGFVVTDGARSYAVSHIPTDGNGPDLLLFVDEIPPRDRDLWIVDTHIPPERTVMDGPDRQGLICFTPGTYIDTPMGPQRIETLRAGDLVQTRDNGAQPITWTGARRMTGARLFAMPHLRPVRISASALGGHRPDAELLVSPDHRMLVSGPVAQALFNVPEVLVSARHLIDGTSIFADTRVTEVTYVHLLFEQHQILTANSLPSESFHPASANFDMMAQDDLDGLLNVLPELNNDRDAYGPHARRTLKASEAAMLRHAA
jgi:hypothetical protein